MQSLVRGQKIKLSDISRCQQLKVGMALLSPASINLDISCFGVDENNMLSDDRYFIFFNQKVSPCGSLASLGAKDGDQEQFHIDLSALPDAIKKLVFVVTIDGDGVMSQIQDGYIRLLEENLELVRFAFGGSDFKDEKAIMVGEIYLKDTWRFSAIGQGFNGGLSALLKYFGGEEDNTPSSSGHDAKPAATAKPQPSKALLLEKNLQERAPKLVNLAKKLSITLEKKQLQDVIAKVAIVVDASGSMALAYRNDSVQSVLDRISLVAARMDDDGNLKTWFYASKFQKFPDITTENVGSYLKTNLKRGFLSIVKGLGMGNNEPPIMQEILTHYKDSKIPVLVIFITDGGIYETQKIKQILLEASNFPIFWQFVGLAGSDYGVLEGLDNMSGRVVDNANFFAVDDLAQISDDELYDRLLNEFPSWLKESKEKGIII